MGTQKPIGCLGAILRVLGLSSDVTPPAPALPKVQVNKYFVTNAEADFFRVLRAVVADRGHILAQVSLRQLLWLPGNNRSNSGRAAWQNKIAAKSVDFVVCDPATLQPRLVVELDEPSHAIPERQKRDDQVQSLLEAADMPLVRVLTSRSYSTRELAATILPHLKS